MRHALLLLPLLLLSGCTIVPISYAGQCSATTNWRGCQEDPYIVKWYSADTNSGSESQKSAR